LSGIVSGAVQISHCIVRVIEFVTTAVA